MIEARQEQKHINYVVNRSDDDQVVNCSKSLINETTFNHKFRPQLPRHCLNRLEQYGLVEQRVTRAYYYPVIPEKLYHMNQLVCPRRQPEYHQLVNVKIELERKESRYARDDSGRARPVPSRRPGKSVWHAATRPKPKLLT